MNKLNQSINIGLVIIFFGLAIYTLQNPALFGMTNDASARATLCGAMFGAGTLLLGNQINYYFQALDKNKDLEKKQETLRALLVAEMVSLFVNHIQQAFYYKQAVELITDGMPTNGYPLDKTYQVPIPVVFNALINELIILPHKEVDALVNMYDNLAKTRAVLKTLTDTNTAMTLITTTNLKLNFTSDCENAAGVIKMLAPNRRIQKTNGDLILFSELLMNPQKI
jgi:hypothetical protein